MADVLIFLRDHPKETDLIGRILIAYGELEHALIDLVAATLDEDADTAIRTLFRLRSEGQRLDVADAISRKWMEQQNLGGPYGQALGAIRHCKKIRNQYAHCTWYSKGGQLAFINLEEAAETTKGECVFTTRKINLELLQKQREFFDYTESLLIHVSDAYRRKVGREVRDRENSKPKQLARPKTHL